LTFLYGASGTEIDPICRDKFVEYIKSIDEKTMKNVKEFFVDAIALFKTKSPAEFEASNLKILFEKEQPPAAVPPVPAQAPAPIEEKKG